MSIITAGSPFAGLALFSQINPDDTAEDEVNVTVVDVPTMVTLTLETIWLAASYSKVPEMLSQLPPPVLVNRVEGIVQVTDVAFAAPATSNPTIKKNKDKFRFIIAFAKKIIPLRQYYLGCRTRVTQQVMTSYDQI